MIRIHCVLAITLAAHGSLEAADWLSWRGPNQNGVADASPAPPTTWSESQNIVWKANVPGRGHSSPILVGNKVILTSADERTQTQAVLCYNREDGSPLWKTDVNRGGLPRRIHNKNTHATPTVAGDGERLYVAFSNHDSVQLTALNLDGDQVWQINAGGMRPRAFQYGYAPSPVLYESSIIVAAEFEDGGYIAAFDKQRGREMWRIPRLRNISYSTPIVGRVAGRDQLLISGAEQVASFDPRTGQALWSVPGTTKATCGTMVWDAERVYASGGYPDSETIAVAGDGSRRVAWRNREKCYEQSMLVHDGHVYAVTDNGVAFCWHAETGERRWQARLGGPVSASPILVGDVIYAANEAGTMFVFRASPESYQELGRNQLGDEGFATVAVADGRIYLRTATGRNDARREALFCIGDQ